MEPHKNEPGGSLNRVLSTRGALRFQRLDSRPESSPSSLSSPPSSTGMPSPSIRASNVSLNSPSQPCHQSTSSTSSSMCSTMEEDCSSTTTRTACSTPSITSSRGGAPPLQSKLPPRDENSSSSEGSTMQLWQRKPDAKLKIRTLCLFGALLPGLGCYICIAYTYLFQLDRVMNFTATDCPEVKVGRLQWRRFLFYSIGVWKPQKYFWLMILAFHLPPRLFYGIVCKNQYFTLGESIFKERTWYRRMIHIHVWLMAVEGFGLVAVSIIDIETYFVLHAISYAVWVISFNFNMLFNTLLHHHSGIRKLGDSHEKIFYVKCAIFLLGYPLSVSTGFTYFGYMFTCSGLAYALFSIAEYILVGLNSIFYFLLVLQLPESKIEIFLKHGDHLCRNEITL